MATTEGRDGTLVKKHHEQNKFCYRRPAYREARWERAVKVYTINQESRYLLVQGIPSVGVTKELVELFAIYGAIEEYRYLDEYPGEEFTDVYWIKFQKIQAARYAKKKLDMRSFYGGILHVCYAPEYENVEDTREKLIERRQVVARKCREYYPKKEAIPQESINQTIDNVDGNKPPASSCHKLCSFIRPPKQPTPTHMSAVNLQVPSQASPRFPALPLPPVNLPLSSLPPLPLPKVPLEYPRVPTKNATLPRELQNYGYGSKPTMGNNSPSPVNPNKEIAQAIPKETAIGIKRPFEAQSVALSSHEHSKGKRIVWHNQPGPSASALSRQSHSEAIPGAWDPFAEERKQQTSLTGDQHLDDVALKIRERLKQTTSFKHLAVESKGEGHSTSGHQPMSPQKKSRKRI